MLCFLACNTLQQCCATVQYMPRYCNTSRNSRSTETQITKAWGAEAKLHVWVLLTTNWISPGHALCSKHWSLVFPMEFWSPTRITACSAKTTWFAVTSYCSDRNGEFNVISMDTVSGFNAMRYRAHDKTRRSRIKPQLLVLLQVLTRFSSDIPRQ